MANFMVTRNYRVLIEDEELEKAPPDLWDQLAEAVSREADIGNLEGNLYYYEDLPDQKTQEKRFYWGGENDGDEEQVVHGPIAYKCEEERTVVNGRIQ